MHPALKHFTSILDCLTELVDSVRAQVNLERPRFAPPGIAKKLKAGIRMIEVYLRRVIIALALQLEHSLVDKPAVVKTGKRSALWERGPVFRVMLDQYLNKHKRAELWERAQRKREERVYQQKRPARPVFMVTLYKRLDRLAVIAADPLKKAQTLAYRLARGREGYIMCPDLRYRPAGCIRRLWRTETSMTFSLLGYQIGTNSKTRPPQLPARKKPERADIGPRIRTIDFTTKAYPWPEWLPAVQWQWSRDRY